MLSDCSMLLATPPCFSRIKRMPAAAWIWVLCCVTAAPACPAVLPRCPAALQMEKVCDMLIERVHELEKEDAALRWVGGWVGAGRGWGRVRAGVHNAARKGLCSATQALQPCHDTHPCNHPVFYPLSVLQAGARQPGAGPRAGTQGEDLRCVNGGCVAGAPL